MAKKLKSICVIFSSIAIALCADGVSILLVVFAAFSKSIYLLELLGFESATANSDAKELHNYL